MASKVSGEGLAQYDWAVVLNDMLSHLLIVCTICIIMRFTRNDFRESKMLKVEVDSICIVVCEVTVAGRFVCYMEWILSLLHVQQLVRA